LIEKINRGVFPRLRRGKTQTQFSTLSEFAIGNQEGSVMKKELIKDIVDLHSHLLPGIDDGAKTMEESLAMLRVAQSQGITVMACTPHLVLDNMHRQYCSKAYSHYKKLRAAAKSEGIGVKLIFGFELMLDESIYTCQTLSDYTIDNTHLLLIEASVDWKAETLFDAAEWLILKGFIPLLAHPERLRNSFGLFDFDNIKKLKKLNERGLILQINAAGITGFSGIATRLRAMRFITSGMDFIVGSDAHSPKGRLTEMQSALHFIEKLKGHDKTIKSVCTRPLQLLSKESTVIT
jgi:protein-tyrosine phosphatase